MFGDGEICKANAISEADLADVMADCITMKVRLQPTVEKGQRLTGDLDEFSDCSTSLTRWPTMMCMNVREPLARVCGCNRYLCCGAGCVCGRAFFCVCVAFTTLGPGRSVQNPKCLAVAFQEAS